MKTEQETILILGATGKTGRRIAQRLKAAGRPVRLGSRGASPAFDWDDQSTWAAALDGIHAVYVSFQPDLAVPGALETIQAFTNQAVNSGVRKLVLLSGRGEIEAEQAEHVVQSSGIDWTILRASWFAQNFSEAHFLEPILQGEFVLPVGNIAEPFIDAEDIAEIAVAALTQPGHSNQLYELTGPRALTFAEAVKEIARETNRDIHFTSISAHDYRQALEQEALPDEVIDLVLYLFTTVLDGRNTPLADGVQRALGRPARDFSDYVRRTAATGVWANKG
ncbi:NmrA family NAD(P)-binding protein [Pseudomonas frederiksbergensis]|uniref:NmrA family NAD(P)-binding protein n=1 Tax=Pseudomonas frederiksbergensis TaxID=104087 RepID=UPI000F47BF69|nr:NAD(P)H-binding protein [Pseudomonas frederiksbergensis]RON54461.1 NmrA family transcriptional regulator [Pseudomonas frederiksbergensis]